MIALIQRDHLFRDFVESLLAAFDLTRCRALANEPAPVDLRIEMIVCKVAADETFTCNGGTVVAEFFQGIAFDVMTEEQVYEGAGSRVFGGNLGSESVACYFFSFVFEDTFCIK